jgi:S-adenosylmethionine-diacylglycerol 3-amino-3-carboxypropyl transferase
MSSTLWAKGRLGKAGGQPEIIFAQVREDAAIELEVLRSRPAGETAFCIASGGCTAMALLLARPTQVHAVDVNPAQIFLVELKKTALLHLPYAQTLRCLLQDARPFYERLRLHISQAAQTFWDARPHLLAQGLNNCGVIERRLRQLMRLLPFMQSRRNVRWLFSCKNLREQRQVYRTQWNHWRWKLAFEMTLCKPVLKLVYGQEFLRAVPSHFGRRMKCRMDEAFLRYPIQDNGYLWQMFRGVYPKSVAALPLYLQPENHKEVQHGLSRLQAEHDDAALWLEEQAPNSIGFFALSNILEITSPAYAKRLLEAIARAAKPDAKVCLRSIFPFGDAVIEGARVSGAKFEFLPADDLENKDRSFFCKNLRVLRVLKP